MKIDLTHLTEAELIELNRQIVARIKIMRKSDNFAKMLKFKLGDEVCFEDSKGQIISGEIVKLNKDTFTVCAHGHGHYRVSPSLLSKVINSKGTVVEILPAIADNRVKK